MRANDLMKHNVKALLKGRGLHRRDLAQWCRRSDAWISKILSEDRREFPMKYWDRIADYFGISVYQLIQPGISGLTERRRGERRVGRDRRVRNVALVVHDRVPLARAISDEVFRLGQEDLEVLAETLAATKLRRISVPNTAASPHGPEPDTPPTGSAPRVLRMKTTRPK